jgi:hypothetical protein
MQRGVDAIICAAAVGSLCAVGLAMNSLMTQLINLFYRLAPVALTAVAFLLVGCEGSSSGQPAAPTAQTAIPVAPEFRDFYDAYGGAGIFGEPIARPVIDPDSGRLVQYFAHMRLEFVDAAAGGQPSADPIAIYPLGEWAYDGVAQRAPAVMPETDQERYFPETGYTIRNGFLAFYEANNGERLLGPPISELLDGGGKWVQYFRNARLEWHPHLPAGSRVRLGSLGRAHFDSTDMVFLDNEDGRLSPAQPQPDIGLEKAVVDAAVGSPFVYRGEVQQLSVRVETVDRRPGEGARIVVEIRYDNVVKEEVVGLSDSAGLWYGPLDVTAIPAEKIVQLRVQVYNRENKLLGEDFVSFRTWW